VHLLSVFSLRNRALIALLTLVVGGFGAFALTTLKQDLFPQLTIPQLVVVTSYPGASPDVVETDVSTPIETAIQGVPGLDGTVATSTSGASTVSASFAYGTNIATAEQKVQLAINRLTTLPEGADVNVLTGSLDDFPVIQIAVTSDLGSDELSSRLEASTITDIQQLDGVREAALLGTTGKRVTITPDLDELAKNGFTSQSIRDALKNNGVLLAAGQITEDGQTLTVQSGERLTSADDIAALPLLGGRGPVTLPDGTVIEPKRYTIGDLAEVAVVDDPVTGISRVNGEPALTISVTKTPDGNTVEVSKDVRDAIPDLEAAIGDGTRFTIVFDQAPYIQQSIESLATEGLLGLAFAVLVILIFLLSLRSTLVTAISIPLSVLITFLAMLATGYSLNVITLGALTIAIGRVVDDSIVVIENIKRHLGLGEPKLDAIKSGVREVATAVTASTVTTVAVFLPLALVSDLTGELFRPFALTVTIALAASLFVALTIVPVLAYWFLRAPLVEEPPAPHGRFAASAAGRGILRFPLLLLVLELVLLGAIAVGGWLLVGGRELTELPQADLIVLGALALVAVLSFVGYVVLARLAGVLGAQRRWAAQGERPEPVLAEDEDELDKPTLLQRGYLPIVRWTVRFPAITLIAALIVMAGSFGLATTLKTNFIGSSGPNTLTVTQTLPAGTSLDAMDDASSPVEDGLREVDGIETVQVSIGSSGNSFRSFFGGGASITYSVTTDEDVDQERIQQDVRDLIDGLDPDEVGEVSLASGGSSFASSDIEVQVEAPNGDTLERAADQVLDAVKDLDVTAQAESDLAVVQPYIAIQVDRDKAAEAGLSEIAVGGIVADAMLPASIGTVVIDEKTLKVYISNPDAPLTVQELRDFLIPTSTGPEKLSTVATVEQVDGPSSITTIRGVRSATITVTPNGDDVGTASASVSAAVEALDLPDGATATLGGVTADQENAFQQLGLALLAAILIVYTVMVATFRSLRQPLLLLVSVPFAATGAVLLQIVSGVPLGVASIIGLLMLVGIVVTNAIVLIDLVNQYRDRGLKVNDAVAHGAARRLRPILMTALATIFALVPMALGITGHGGFISQPLAIIVIGGLISSTVLTLIVLPSLYALVEGAKERREDRRARRAAGEPKPSRRERASAERIVEALPPTLDLPTAEPQPSPGPAPRPAPTPSPAPPAAPPVFPAPPAPPAFSPPAAPAPPAFPPPAFPPAGPPPASQPPAFPPPAQP
jgi:HAE1 family hydrophobic/amphiphilic exporter-1